MWWKVYFWIYLVLMVIGLFALTGSSLKPIEIFSVAFELLGLFAVYSYVFHKQTLNQKAWQIIFWIQVVLFIYSFLALYGLLDSLVENFEFLQGSVEISKGSQLFALLFELPALYAMYLLSKTQVIFNKTKKK